MARLIPTFMDDRTPPGEQEVFNRLAAGPEEWIALHSLDLAPWNRGLRTEIDFVLIVPDTGMVCIEVKSHKHISFESDRWTPQSIKRSPFKQASDGRHAFYRRLRDLAPQFRHFPVVHCCVFSQARFDVPRNLSVQDWELIDGRRFQGYSSSDEFCADLKDRMLRAIEADPHLTTVTKPLSAPEIESIVDHCLPVQRHRPTARDEIEHRVKELTSLLREQQRPVLKLAERNPRVVVTGAAGTGKTLIALEIARQRAETGRRVGLLCFNQLVGNWLTGQIEGTRPSLPNLVTGRAIKVMASMAGLELPTNLTPTYWDTNFPDELEAHLTDPDFEATAAFDYLVVDEAQDLLARPRLWECLIRFLHGGLEKGSFILFGDFQNQVLGDRDAMNQCLDFIGSKSHPAMWELSENCRNYKFIGQTAVALSGLVPPVYSGYMRPQGGHQNFEIAFYEEQQEQLEQLAQWLREFKRKKYRPHEISILSFCRSETSAAAILSQRGFQLHPAWQQREATSYTSVHAFKGLESKVVILTDVVLGEAESHRSLFYVGLTRASEYVRVLCKRSSQDTLARWLTGDLGNV